MLHLCVSQVKESYELHPEIQNQIFEVENPRTTEPEWVMFHRV